MALDPRTADRFTALAEESRERALPPRAALVKPPPFARPARVLGLLAGGGSLVALLGLAALGWLLECHHCLLSDCERFAGPLDTLWADDLLLLGAAALFCSGCFRSAAAIAAVLCLGLPLRWVAPVMLTPVLGATLLSLQGVFRELRRPFRGTARA